MKRHSYSLYVLLFYISFVMVSCNSGKNFNYSSAYKFQIRDPYGNGNSRTATKSQSPTLDASIDSINGQPEQMLVSTERNIVLPNRIVNPLINKFSEKKSAPAVADARELKTLTVKEIRKEIRVGFKKYRNEIKERQKINGVEKTHDSSFGKGLLLVILGLAIIVGGILLINPIGVLAGSLIAAVGLILFLIGLLGILL